MQGKSNGREKRQNRRMGVALKVRIHGVNPAGAPFAASTSSSDVSRGGCSFVLSQPVNVGSELDLIIDPRRDPRPQGGREREPFITQAVVVRVTEQRPGKYAVGVQFTGARFPTYTSESTAGE